MNFGAQQPSAKIEPKSDPAALPIAGQIIEAFEYNLNRLNGTINAIEDKCHALLNLRSPQAEGKGEVPMESDLSQALSNRLNRLAMLNDKLESLASHLSKIV